MFNITDPAAVNAGIAKVPVRSAEKSTSTGMFWNMKGMIFGKSTTAGASELSMVMGATASCKFGRPLVVFREETTLYDALLVARRGVGGVVLARDINQPDQQVTT